METLMTDARDRTLVLTRHFRASHAQVYAAWTDPEALPRWFGPDGFTCTVREMDVRNGGRARFDMTSPVILSRKIHGPNPQTADFNSGRLMVGTGPYRHVDYRQSERLELARNT